MCLENVFKKHKNLLYSETAIICHLDTNKTIIINILKLFLGIVLYFWILLIG